MKRFIQSILTGAILALLTPSSILSAHEHHTNKGSCEQVDKKLHAIEKKLCCIKEELRSQCSCEKKVTTIFQKDIPFEITKPGVYCLAENVVHAPTVEGTSAIHVKASAVVLDLNGNRALQGPGLLGLAAKTYGITVDDKASVIIHDGFLEAFTQNGIFLNGTSEVFIENVHASLNGVAAMNAANESNSTGGLFLRGVTNAQIRHSTFNQNQGLGSGIGITASSNVIVDACTCNNNLGGFINFEVPEHYSFGLGIFDFGEAPFEDVSSNIWIKNSAFNENYGDAASSGVAVLTFSDRRFDGIVIENSIGNGNFTAGNVSSARNAFGFVFEGGTNNLVVRQCSASSNDARSIPTSIAGAIGFRFNAITGLLVEDCASYDNRGANFATAASKGFDFFAVQSVLFQRCHGSNHGYDGFLGVACGLDTGASLSDGVVIDDCTFQNNRGRPDLSAGLRIRSLSKGLIQNCTSANNTNGIILTATTNFQNLFRNNTVQNNALKGFVDTLPAAQSVYIGNIASFNGVAAGDNYSDPTVFSNQPIRQWLVPGLPSTADNNGIVDPLDNIDIHL